MPLKIFSIVFVAIFPTLLAGCGAMTGNQESAAGPESTVNWQGRAKAAWSSMSDGLHKLTDADLDRALVQNGMSTDHSITFVVYPPKNIKDKPDFTAKDLMVSVRKPNTESKPVAKSDLVIVKVGRAFRVTVENLVADTAYTVDVVPKGEKKFILRTRTAPGASRSTTASIILLSCNEPWSRDGEEQVDKKNEYPRVAPSTANALRLLDLRASGKLPVVIDGKESGKPSFLLGLGDQVYVDAEPTHRGSLALFGDDRSDKLRIDVGGPKEWGPVLETVYRMHLLIPTFDRALRSLPTAMVWDDHEIRDGWGSQGDETGEIRTKPKLTWAEYFAAAREKAWEFEVTRNPDAGGKPLDRDTDPKSDSKREMDTSFDWGPRIKVFMMDTRTARKTTKASIQNESQTEQPMASSMQLDRLDRWLDKCGDKPSVYVLGVPVALTMDREHSFFSSLSTEITPELSDDIIDGWGWRGHAKTRQQLIAAMKRHARQCPKDRIVVVSGDVHESGLHALLDNDNHVYAYEIISSGVGTLIGKQSGVNKAQISTSGTTISEGVTQVGRIAGGASFAELFVDMDGDCSPKLRVLFYSTTGASDDQRLKSTLVNAAPWVEKQRVWSTGSTSVADLFEGNRSRFVTTGNFALQLDYGIPPPAQKPRGTNYGLTSAAMRCEVPNSNVLNTFATNWISIMDNLGHCW